MENQRNLEDKDIYKKPFAIIAIVLIIISYIILALNSASWYYYIISYVIIAEITKFLVKKFIKKLGENVKIKTN